VNEAPPITNIPPLPPVPPFRDRHTGLLVFGILEILLGTLCVLMAGFTALAQVMESQTPETNINSRMMLFGALFYIAFAAVFVWLGIGSIQCRRWARSLLLILAWSWLGVGVIAVPLMGFFMPRILAASPPNGPALPPGMLPVIVVMQLIFMSVLLVVIPGVLVFFYSSRHVKATCEARDTVRHWSDACPLPILAVVCGLWLGAVTMLIFPLAYGGLMPFFGTIVSGLPGTLLTMGLAGLSLWIGWMWYRLKVIGWWALAATMIVLSLSNIITFSHLDIVELYQKMGFPQAQIDLIRRQGLISSRFMVWNSLVWLAPMLGYMLWAKRYFRPAPGDRPPGLVPV